MPALLAQMIVAQHPTYVEMEKVIVTLIQDAWAV
jgi:hypothetical protein